jgi:cyclic pyranopterin phosphate synthase
MGDDALVDRFGRRIDYLRVSVTDRCNFRCVYCMPDEGVPPTPRDEQLTSAELKAVIVCAARLGMRKIRFTGGEPLLRKDLEALIRIAIDAGYEDISLTTNGFGLSERAQRLRIAGLSRLNISLDTLRADRFRTIARRGDIAGVLAGIEAAIGADFHPVKINMVALKGLNSDEASDFAQWTVRTPVHVRFIELMPIRWNLDESVGFDPYSAHDAGREETRRGLLQLRQAPGTMLSDLEMRKAFISSDELRRQIESDLGVLQPASVATNGPARTFRLPDSLGTIGFISQISRDLCANCNRLRLTSDGFLRPCLMSDGEIDVKPALRDPGAGGSLESVFRQVVGIKPERHYLADGQKVLSRNMSQLGG